MAKSILIADDNERNRKLLRVILQKTGYQVHEAVDGREAVRLALEVKPDLVLLDYRMPVMDGIEATKVIKFEPATSRIPVFIVTSSAMSGDRERIIAESGCDMLYTKPIDIRKILESIERATGGAA